MDSVWLYAVPALVAYPVALLIARRVTAGRKVQVAALVGTLVLMVVAVGLITRYGGSQWAPVPIGLAFGVVVGLRHGFAGGAPHADDEDAGA